MPIPKDYQDICEMLRTSTEAKRLNWVEEKPGNASVKMPDFDVEIWTGSDENGRDFVALGLRDPEKQQLIDNWWVEEGDPDYTQMWNLWLEIRRQANRVPDKLEALRKALRASGGKEK
jgi:hypothetical protein